MGRGENGRGRGGRGGRGGRNGRGGRGGQTQSKAKGRKPNPNIPNNVSGSHRWASLTVSFT